jgi:hypothetical protein
MKHALYLCSAICVTGILAIAIAESHANAATAAPSYAVIGRFQLCQGKVDADDGRTFNTLFRIDTATGEVNMARPIKLAGADTEVVGWTGTIEVNKSK